MTATGVAKLKTTVSKADFNIVSPFKYFALCMSSPLIEFLFQLHVARSDETFDLVRTKARILRAKQITNVVFLERFRELAAQISAASVNRFVNYIMS